ncbi:MAG TPA: hypothetical protein VLX68_13065 [Chitinivibrionales bacterium]|nr:hypothetical protein [Chitinivibrionales bacterium]
MRIKFMVVLAGLAWQCCAIQISPDTVFTEGSGVSTNGRFVIRNTNLFDTVFIDTIYTVDTVQSPLVQTVILFRDTTHQYTFLVYGSQAAPIMPRLLLPPNDSQVLMNATLSSTIRVVSSKAKATVAPCIVKAIFVPSIGTKDTVVFIGPCNLTGTRFGTVQSKLPVLNKGTCTRPAEALTI